MLTSPSGNNGLERLKSRDARAAGEKNVTFIPSGVPLSRRTGGRGRATPHKAIIGFEMYDCMFKDPNLFLTGSLDYNCKTFKANCAKQTEFTLANGTTIDNMQLCFYRPELDVWDF
jgi:hypothetical protein